MTRLTYFAYGSNMLTTRLQARCPSAKAIGPARLHGWRLSFEKRSLDGSGKATISKAAAPQALVRGVLFSLHIDDLPVLDRAEEKGVGYDRIDRFAVHCETADGARDAFTYLACAPEPDLQPFDWYLALILAGAREYGLSEEHFAALARTPFLRDPDVDRPARLRALQALRAAGYDALQDLLPR